MYVVLDAPLGQLLDRDVLEERLVVLDQVQQLVRLQHLQEQRGADRARRHVDAVALAQLDLQLGQVQRLERVQLLQELVGDLDVVVAARRLVLRLLLLVAVAVLRVRVVRHLRRLAYGLLEVCHEVRAHVGARGLLLHVVSEGGLQRHDRLLRLLVLRAVLVLRVDQRDLLQVLDGVLEVAQALVNERQVVVHVGDLEAVLAELVLAQLGRVLEHHERDGGLAQQLEDDAQVVVAVAGHVAAQLRGAHEAGDGLVELLLLHVVRAHHEEAVRGLVRVAAEHLLDVRRVDLVQLDHRLVDRVQDVGHRGHQRHFLDRELLHDQLHRPEFTRDRRPLLCPIVVVVAHAEMVVVVLRHRVVDSVRGAVLPRLAQLLLARDRDLLLRHLAMAPLSLLFLQALEADHVAQVLQEVHLLLDIGLDHNGRLGSVAHVQPAPRVQAHGDAVLELVEDLAGRADVLLLDPDHLLGVLDAVVVDLVHVVVEVLMPQLAADLVHLLLLLAQPVRVHDAAVLAVHAPVLQLVLARAVGRPLALPAHEEGLLAAVLAIHQGHYFYVVWVGRVFIEWD